MNLSRFAMNRVTLAGDLEAKLDAISNAGFHAIELWAKDLTWNAHASRLNDSALGLRSQNLTPHGKANRHDDLTRRLKCEIQAADLLLLIGAAQINLVSSSKSFS